MFPRLAAENFCYTNRRGYQEDVRCMEFINNYL